MHLDYPFGTFPLPQPSPDCRFIVTVPAKDEAGFITSTLDALRLQHDEDGQKIPYAWYEVFVLANNCSDTTAELCRAYAKEYPTFNLHIFEKTFRPEVACVGTVRRIMMDTAHKRFRQLGRMKGIICTTDADTTVASDWIYQNLRAVEEGARAVGGRILVPISDNRNVAYRKQHLQDVVYRSLQSCLESILDPCDADPWPRHFQHFGPSISVTATAYEQCGGIPPLKSLEDVFFVQALERVDILVTHNPKVRVYTSSRISHRVDGRAFSHQLDEWAGMETRAESQMVISFANCLNMFKWKVALRRAYFRGTTEGYRNLKAMVGYLDWSAEELEHQVRNATTFGSLYQPIRGQLENNPDFRNQPINEAIDQLRSFTRSLRHRAGGTPQASSVLSAHYALS